MHRNLNVYRFPIKLGMTNEANKLGMTSEVKCHSSFVFCHSRESGNLI